MKLPLDLPVERLFSNMEFVTDLCHDQQQPFRIDLGNGRMVMLVPLMEKPTIPADIVEQVDELKKEWMEQVDSKNSATQ
tara:strand:- start:218 stop:454 length:237 start_codon:yes stop_codon:yes gene_type:complete